MISTVSYLYDDLTGIVSTKSWMTDPIHLQTGVYQGALLSVLVFSTVMNPLSNRVNMQDVSTPKVFVSPVFVTDEEFRGRNILHIDPIATCSLETDHLFTLHCSMSLYQIMNTLVDTITKCYPDLGYSLSSSSSNTMPAPVC